MNRQNYIFYMIILVNSSFFLSKSLSLLYIIKNNYTFELMREAAFIKSNREKWQRIDEQTLDKDIQAEILADNFIELTDDLSYARTFYPKSQTLKYLNQLTGRYFVDIYRFRKKEKGRFFRFWKLELPLIMYKYRRYMLYSFIFMLLGVLLGVFSQYQNPDFAYTILGETYVNMTLDNIAKGDPMAVYKGTQETPMFMMISSNNIMVAFNAFVFGFLGSILSIWIMFSNGVMLGVFQFFFYQHGLLGTSMLSIWLHGTLEISAIIIAGGAGIILGNSILFPGSYRRRDSLLRAAKDALKIAVGLVPVFILAAFIESYLTRMTEMPIIFNLIIILFSAIIIIGYFFYYPYWLNKKMSNENLETKPDYIGTEIEYDSI